MSNTDLSRLLYGFGIFAGVSALCWYKRELREDVPQTSNKPIEHPEQTANQTEDMSTNTSLPRGYRNNNPLNIRISQNAWKGKIPLAENTDGTFEQFRSMAYGYRAAMKLIQTYIRKYNCHTLAQIISRWAPPSENYTASYIANVANRMGIEPTDYINPSNGYQMKELVRAMSYSENGTKIEPDDSAIQEAWTLM